MTAMHKQPERTSEEMDRWEWKNEIIPRLRASGIDERYHSDKTGEWRCEPQERVFKLCLRLCAGKGAIVALTGARGTGKTTIASQMILDRARNTELPPWDRQPPYRKLSDIVTRYKPLYADFGSVNTDDLCAARDWYCRSLSLAIIDEIHECKDTKYGERILTDILDRRYAARKDTILISNEKTSDFEANHSDSIQSRISEHGRIIECNWQSWRAKEKL